MSDGVESRMLREIMARTGTDKRLNSADELTRLRAENAALRATLKQVRKKLVKANGLCTIMQTYSYVSDAIQAIDKVQP